MTYTPISDYKRACDKLDCNIDENIYSHIFRQSINRVVVLGIRNLYLVLKFYA